MSPHPAPSTPRVGRSPGKAEKERGRQKLQIANLEFFSLEVFTESLGSLRAEIGGWCAPREENGGFSKSVLESTNPHHSARLPTLFLSTSAFRKLLACSKMNANHEGTSWN